MADMCIQAEMTEDSKSKLRFENYEIKNESDFVSIKTIWQDLENGIDMTVYQTYDWNLLLYKEEKASGLAKVIAEVHVIVFWKDRKPICIVPLVINKHTVHIGNHGRKRGVFILGYRSYSDYLNLIYNEISEADVNEILAAIYIIYCDYPIQFTDVIVNTVFGKALVNRNEGVLTESIAVEVIREKDLQTYNSLLSKSVKQNLRTARNRMERDALLYKYEIHQGPIDESLINFLLELHLRRMKTKNRNTENYVQRIKTGLDVYLRARKEKNNNIIRESMKNMKQSFCEIVYLNDEIVGYLYGLVDRKSIRIMQNCVDDKYRFYSPMFRGAYDFICSTYTDSSVDIVDFTRGNEQYKYQLHGTEKKLISLTVN